MNFLLWAICMYFNIHRPFSCSTSHSCGLYACNSTSTAHFPAIFLISLGYTTIIFLHRPFSCHTTHLFGLYTHVLASSAHNLKFTEVSFLLISVTVQPLLIDSSNRVLYAFSAASQPVTRRDPHSGRIPYYTHLAHIREQYT